MKDCETKKDVEEFSVDCDITLKKVEGLVERVLLGHLEYIKMNLFEMIHWVSENWKQLLDYQP